MTLIRVACRGAKVPGSGKVNTDDRQSKILTGVNAEWSGPRKMGLPLPFNGAPSLRSPWRP